MKKKARIEKVLFKAIQLRDDTKAPQLKERHVHHIEVLTWVLSDSDEDFN